MSAREPAAEEEARPLRVRDVQRTGDGARSAAGGPASGEDVPAVPGARRAVAPARLAYSRQEAAELLDVGEYTVRALVRKGELPVVRIGRHDRIPHTAIEAYLERQLEVRDTA